MLLSVRSPLLRRGLAGSLLALSLDACVRWDHRYSDPEYESFSWPVFGVFVLVIAWQGWRSWRREDRDRRDRPDGDDRE